jgi:HTH-type transcriptional regulator / antitoxin HigA
MSNNAVKYLISSEAEYRSALAAIEPFLQKGFDNLSSNEDEELASITKAIEEYETMHYHLPFTPKTLTEMIELKMFELKLKQRELAKLLGVTENRISEILNGKRKINLDFAKRLHEKLNIDAKFILSNI